MDLCVVYVGILALLTVFVVFVVFASYGQGQDIPQCVIDAFPELNQTSRSYKHGFTEFVNPYTGVREDGLGCRLCVELITEVEVILTDPTIEDAVRSSLAIPIFVLTSQTYFSDCPCSQKSMSADNLGV